MAELRASYPAYFMAKRKLELGEGIDVEAMTAAFKERYRNEKINETDGIKVDFADSWVHLRRSNTEPIVRIYTEAPTQEAADDLAQRIIHELQQMSA